MKKCATWGGGGVFVVFKKIVCAVLIFKEREVIKRDEGLLNIISEISSWQLQRQCMQRGVVINVELVTPALVGRQSLSLAPRFGLSPSLYSHSWRERKGARTYKTRSCRI